MDRSEAIAKLKQHEMELKRLGIEHLYLFGSTARGEAREDSDIDLGQTETEFVEHRRTESMGIGSGDLSGVTSFLSRSKAGRGESGQ